ncbi:hypothetical protein FIA58_000220 [Flavobacterium jejuense]|uniref:Uncharacterized protein n=1 Tax=Flavobacterium jejuense TaxID=1544455 RepID=A0ABX0IPN1_9FLAO|nr:hypothetical protein [Flavobacterium jejuense]NHN24086.1 hypothetical protein [Flavobacterium jejuense]
MRKIAIAFLLGTVSITFGQEMDTLKIIEIPESYANRIGEPFIVKQDSLYLFRTADVYLVNKKSFLAIKNVYQSTINQDKMTKDLIEKYTETLSRNIDLERRLEINFTQTDSLDQIVYEKTQATLNNTQKALDYTVKSLESATTSLELVEKATKRERRKTVFEKVLIGVAGVGVGILIGISL